jgi:NAD(P)H-dependent flavin oxidoreductase YrpB (nitropropane dioxygenase family)
MIRTALTELLGIRYPVVQAAMGYVSGPRLAAATSDAGGLGLIASATMSLAELEKAIEETAGRTAGPFGVNLRADAPDAAERVRLIVARRVPVASFAQAPKPELIAALKDAGVVTIASFTVSVLVPVVPARIVTAPLLAPATVFTPCVVAARFALLVEGAVSVPSPAATVVSVRSVVS